MPRRLRTTRRPSPLPPPPSFEPPPAAEPVFADSTDQDHADVDTNELYLAQNPTAQVRTALKDDASLREKVEMVRRFFDGKVFDPSGQEISLRVFDTGRHHCQNRSRARPLVMPVRS